MIVNTPDNLQCLELRPHDHQKSDRPQSRLTQLKDNTLPESVRGDAVVLLTAKQVAVILQVSPAWVRDHATRKQPRLPSIAVGRLRRFSLTDIRRWIEEQAETPC